MERTLLRAPRLSVVTITYRDPAGLAATIDSLRALRDAGINWEHIVVDASPDESTVALATATWPIVHLREPPAGIYAALNAGARAARATAIWFLNGGDRLVDVAPLRAALGALEAGAGLAVAGANLRRDGKFLYSVRPAVSYFRALAGANRVCHQAVVYDAAAFRRVGEFSTAYRLAGDYEHHLRCRLAGLQMRTVPGILVDYDMGGSSSDFRAVFAEFARAQRELGGRFGFAWRLANGVGRRLEYLRVALLKSTARSLVGESLRPLWLAWNRRKG